MKVKYVGYQGHFCCNCKYHLTTIISNSKRNIIVSTVGNCPDQYTAITILRPSCLFETLVFEAKESDLGFIEIIPDKELDSKYYPILTNEQEAELLGNRLKLEDLNVLALESEKLADIGHRELVDKWVKILGEEDDN